MSKNRNHHTANDVSIMEAMSRKGKSEMRFKRDDQWRKISGGRLFTGPTRAAVRKLASDAKAA